MTTFLPTCRAAVVATAVIALRLAATPPVCAAPEHATSSAVPADSPLVGDPHIQGAVQLLRIALPSLAGLIRGAAGAVVGIEGEHGALGSGFVVRGDGLVVTNKHLVRQDTLIWVKLSDGSRHPARAIAFHDDADFALIEIQAKATFPVLVPASEDGLEVGDWVVALGNPFGLGPTASIGIVGAKGRSIGKKGIEAGLIQTDAAINPGNSGGPLLDLKGRVVGVVSSHIGPGGGVGFAVPISVLQDLLSEVAGEPAPLLP